jgi:hypothetical protein
MSLMAFLDANNDDHLNIRDVFGTFNAIDKNDDRQLDRSELNQATEKIFS